MSSILTPLLQKAIGSLVRQGLTAAGVWLVASGLATENEAQQLLGLALPIASILWSLYQKYSSTLLQAVLHELPSGAPPEAVKLEMDTMKVGDKVGKALSYPGV